MSYTREEMTATARFEAEASRGLRCRCIDGHHHGHAHATPDPMAAPHVSVVAPAFGGSVRLTPRDARALSDLLRRYADTHRETEE